MASNTTLNPGASGDVIATKERTHDGDATKVQVVTLAGVSGTEGSYTFGDIGGDATNGLDVDVTRVIPGTSATHLGKAEDAAHSSGDTGVAILAVRRDTAAVGSGTDGDYSTLNVNSSGRLYTSATIDAALPAGTNAIGTVTAVGAAAEDAAASGNPVLIGGRYDSSARTLETGDVGALALNASGQLLVEIAAGAGSGGTAAADDADFTAGTTSGTPIMGSYQSSPTAVTDGDMGIIGITADREVKVSVTSGGVSGKVDDAAFTAGTDEGVLLMGVASSDSVDSGDAGAVAMTTGRALHVAVQSIAAGNNNIGDVDVASIAAGTNTIGNVGLVGRTTGGLSIFRSLDLDESEEDIKTSAGQVYFIHAMNLANSVRYLKFYNATAANVTVGTTTPVLTFPLPTMGDTNGAGFTVSIPQGLAFATAISAAVTTGLADADTGAPGANEVVINIGYA